VNRVFVDSNIPMYAAGAAHPLVEPSRRVITAIAAGQIDAVTDAEVFQEILHRYFRINERAKGFQVFDAFHQIMLGQIVAVDDEDATNARFLAERHPALSSRDLLHLAVMHRHEINTIVTADGHFDEIPEVLRVDPAAWPVR
jgi:predicted nucleic acid-binding protein